MSAPPEEEEEDDPDQRRSRPGASDCEVFELIIVSDGNAPRRPALRRFNDGEVNVDSVVVHVRVSDGETRRKKGPSGSRFGDVPVPGSSSPERFR